MNVQAQNEMATVHRIDAEGDLVRVRVERKKLRGSKKAKPEVTVLHLDCKKRKFTSWPKKWSDALRTSLREELLKQLAS